MKKIGYSIIEADYTIKVPDHILEKMNITDEDILTIEEKDNKLILSKETADKIVTDTVTRAVSSFIDEN
jgi:bifunctional DNA-binding transcriptional regulator/antitoxin component of YhaV-PrlF toxin-antitoxin module